MNIDSVRGYAGPNSPWLTAREAAAYLRVSHRTILLWAKEGKIRGYRLSGLERVTWRFRADELDDKLTAPSVALTGRTQ
jgi:excisionase family DNA binding protein